MMSESARQLEAEKWRKSIELFNKQIELNQRDLATSSSILGRRGKKRFRQVPQQAFDAFKGKYLTGLFYGLVLTYLLGCAAPQQQQSEYIKLEQPIIGLDKAVRPEATEYLIGHGIEPGDYTDFDQDGIYEAQTEPMLFYKGNPIVYSLTGDRAGNLLSMSLSLDINDRNTVDRSKWELLGMLGKIYRTIIPDAEYVPLEIQAAVMSEPEHFPQYEWEISAEYTLIVSWVASMPEHQHSDAYTIFVTIRKER